MDFAFSEEQQMLRDSARAYLAEKYGLDEVAKLARSDEAWRPGSFPEMAELGWTGLSVSEDIGGSGMGFIDEIVIFEELGHALYPGPYFSSVALALPALPTGHELAAAIASGEKAVTVAWAEPPGRAVITDTSDIKTKAEKSNGAWSLTGEKHLVPDLPIADSVIVTATSDDGVGLWVVERDAAEIRARSTMDATRRYGDLSLSGVTGELLVEPGAAPDVLTAIRTKALAAAAVEAVGVGRRALELAIEHVKERKQFDKPIGSYQAVSHQVANSFVEIELARSLAYWAAWCVDESDEQVTVAVPAAKATAGEAAVAACERAIQVHGGIGFTWEHPLHLFYKRAQWLNSFDAFPTQQRSEVAQTLLG